MMSIMIGFGWPLLFLHLHLQPNQGQHKAYTISNPYKVLLLNFALPPSICSSIIWPKSPLCNSNVIRAITVSTDTMLERCPLLVLGFPFFFPQTCNHGETFTSQSSNGGTLFNIDTHCTMIVELYMVGRSIV